jgi:hypothetical protein
MDAPYFVGTDGGTEIGSELPYADRAQQYRPTDAAALAAEVRRLVAGGLTARDIAQALRLDLGAVLELLYRVAA